MYVNMYTNVHDMKVWVYLNLLLYSLILYVSYIYTYIYIIDLSFYLLHHHMMIMVH